jgi:tetratricopeptide (TPR) repeat protein
MRWATWLAAALALACPALKADYKQAVAFYMQGRYDKAIQEIKPDLDQNPDWEFGHRLAGLSYLKLKNNALAIASLSRAMALKSKSFSTYLGLGQAYFNMQRYENCVETLNQGEPLAAAEKESDAVMSPGDNDRCGPRGQAHDTVVAEPVAKEHRVVLPVLHAVDDLLQASKHRGTPDVMQALGKELDVDGVG